MTERLSSLALRLRTMDPDLYFTENELLSRHTTLRLGGPADLWAEPANEKQLQLLLKEANALDIPVTVVGHGSNLLVLDGGIRGLVIAIGTRMRGCSVEGTQLIARAGTMMSSVAAFAAEHQLAGLAFASGIPGTIGGGVYMNAGAYGGELSQIVTAVSGIDASGEAFMMDRDTLAFGYRTSALQQMDRIVTEVHLDLMPGDRDSILAEMASLNARRIEKQPLSDPSAGSTFKRPEGAFAAALIDQCGLKGYQIGGASVSEKHAGFLINRGGTAADFLNLINYVRETVARETGFLLEPEVRILGENESA